MKEITIKFMISLALLIIGSLLGVFFQSKREEQEGQMRFLEYSIDVTEDLIQRPELERSELEILLDGTSIENICSVQFRIYNLTDKDFQNVLIFFELIPISRDSSDEIKIIASELQTGAGLPNEAIRKLDSVVTSKYKGGKRVGYEILTLNRSESIAPILIQNFFIIGENAPQPFVEVLKTGLSMKPFELPLKTDWMGILALFAIFALILLGIFDPTRSEKKFRTKLCIAVESYFSRGDTVSHVKSKATPKEIAKDIVEIYQDLQRSKLMKWITRKLVEQIQKDRKMSA